MAAEVEEERLAPGARGVAIMTYVDIGPGGISVYAGPLSHDGPTVPAPQERHGVILTSINAHPPHVSMGCDHIPGLLWATAERMKPGWRRAHDGFRGTNPAHTEHALIFFSQGRSAKNKNKQNEAKIEPQNRSLCQLSKMHPCLLEPKKCFFASMGRRLKTFSVLSRNSIPMQKITSKSLVCPWVPKQSSQDEALGGGIILLVDAEHVIATHNQPHGTVG